MAPLVLDAPDLAEDDGSAVLAAVPDDPVVVALPPEESRSSPAVMVTGERLLERSLRTTVDVPGSFASVPAFVSTQLAVLEAT